MKKLLIFAISTVLLAAGCSKDGDGSINYGASPIVIDPTLADPELFPKAATRVTDTDFEEGDRIGVTIRLDGQTFIGNREFTFDAATKLFTASGARWYDDAKRTSELSAYYPYQAGAAAPAEFSVLPDQTGDNYKKSDFIAGIKPEVRPDKEVDLVFKHKMARLIVNVTNKSDFDITAILFKGAIGTGCYDATTGDFSVKAEAALLDVKACERRKNELYYALLVPQNGVAITAAVTTADGEEREATIQDPETGQTAVDLVSGCNRILDMTVTPDGLRIQLSGEIDPWKDGADIPTDNGEEPDTPEPAENTISWGGVNYKTVTLADGRTWMAENLRYVPEGKSVSSDPADGNGIWHSAANASKTADPALDEKVGLLYDAATAFGVTEITAENAASFEGTQGICPNGWHIPTNAEMTGLVGHNANGTLTNPNGAYYDAAAKGALIPTLNEAGFNWCFAGARNQANVTANGSYLVTNYGDVYGAMTYVWGSTLYQVQTDKTSGALKNIQFYSFMSTYNASNNKVSVAYGNFKAGYSVRCIKNADAQ